MKILIGYDRIGWAFYRVSKQFQTYLRSIGHHVDLTAHHPLHNKSEYDLYIAVWFGNPNWDCMGGVRKWVCVYDHFMWADGTEWREVLRSRIIEAERVCCANEILCEQISEAFDCKTTLLTDGVDVKQFLPKPDYWENETYPLRIGWVGNSSLGEGLKRSEIVEQACYLTENHYVSSDPTEGTQRRFSDMCDFYHSLDLLVCSSLSEGTPNPVLEAASCGVPIVSTHVGVVLELQRDSEGHGIKLYNGSVGDLCVKIKEYQHRGRKYLREQGQKLAKTIRNKWTWQHRLEPLAKVGVVSMRKKKVLVIYDSDNWALHRIAQQLKLQLKEFDVDLVSYVACHYGKFYSVDVVIALTYMALPFFLLSIAKDAKWITCQFDEWVWKHDKKSAAAFACSLEYSDMWLFANEAMKERMLQTFQFPAHVGTCQDGVDTNLFRNQPLREDVLDTTTPLRVGWVGNGDKTWFGDLKGLDIVKQAVSESENVELYQANRALNQIPFVYMPQFYRSVDVVVCASEVEGTPNPVLEAGGCGRMVISTSVGITTELKSGIIFVDRDVESFKAAFDRLNEDRMILKFQGQAICGRINIDWTWEKRAEAYREAIHLVLED